MRNFVPLVIAVLLGLAAVLAVGRLLRERKQAQEATDLVVVATRAISVGDTLTEEAIMMKEVPSSARPAQAIFWSRAEMVVGQKTRRSIAQGDYVLLADVLHRSMAEIVGEGEWAVTLPLPPGGVGAIIQPGDEVAVVGTFRVQTAVPVTDLSTEPEVAGREVTLVLFPKVRVLDVAHADRRDRGVGRTEAIVALPPRQAQILIAAKREAELTLALRRPGDGAATRRSDSGMVDHETFVDMLEGLESIDVPDVSGIMGLGSSVL